MRHVYFKMIVFTNIGVRPGVVVPLKVLSMGQVSNHFLEIKTNAY